MPRASEENLRPHSSSAPSRPPGTDQTEAERFSTLGRGWHPQRYSVATKTLSVCEEFYKNPSLLKTHGTTGGYITAVTPEGRSLSEHSRTGRMITMQSSSHVHSTISHILQTLTLSRTTGEDLSFE